MTLPLGDEAYPPCGLEQMRQDVAETIREQSHVYSIIDLQTDQLIGRGLLFGIDRGNGSAMLGIVIGEKALWGQENRFLPWPTRLLAFSPPLWYATLARTRPPTGGQR